MKTYHETYDLRILLKIFITNNISMNIFILQSNYISPYFEYYSMHLVKYNISNVYDHCLSKKIM